MKIVETDGDDIEIIVPDQATSSLERAARQAGVIVTLDKKAKRARVSRNDLSKLQQGLKTGGPVL